MEEIPIYYDWITFTRADVAAAGIKVREVKRWTHGYEFTDLHLSPELNVGLLTDFLSLLSQDGP